MNKNIICLLLTGYIIQSKTEYTFEIIEELIPKGILFSNLETTLYKLYKILKYNLIRDENLNAKTANIHLQFHSFKNSNFDLYLYDNFSEIKQNEYGYFSGFMKELRVVYDGHTELINLI